MLNIFPGRFQPFAKHHLEVARQLIADYRLTDLVVAIADWKGNPTYENPLTTKEARYIARLALTELNSSAKISVVGFALVPGRPFVHQFEIGLKRLSRGDDIRLFSGSKTTIAAATVLAARYTIEIVETEQSESGPRASLIRDHIFNGDERWQDLVVPKTTRYIKHLRISERMRQLEKSGVKRPWTETK